MQPHQRVELVLEDHHHVGAAQQLAQHDALVDALTTPERVARIADLFPVLEGRALVVAPELGTAVEFGEIRQGLFEAFRLPVGGAARQILRNVETERVCQFLVLDRCEVEVRRRLDVAVRQRHAIVDRLHCAGAERLAGQEFGGDDGRGEFLEHRLAVGAEPEQQVGHEYRHQPRQRAAEIDRHLFARRIRRPQRIAGLDQRCAESVGQHVFDFLLGGVDDGLLSDGILRINHRLTDHAKADAFERAGRAIGGRMLCIAAFDHRGARYGGVRIARIVIAVVGVL